MAGDRAHGELMASLCQQRVFRAECPFFEWRFLGLPISTIRELCRGSHLGTSQCACPCRVRWPPRGFHDLSGAVTPPTGGDTCKSELPVVAGRRRRYGSGLLIRAPSHRDPQLKVTNLRSLAGTAARILDDPDELVADRAVKAGIARASSRSVLQIPDSTTRTSASPAASGCRSFDQRRRAVAHAERSHPRGVSRRPIADHRLARRASS